MYARIVDDTRELWTFGDLNDREKGDEKITRTRDVTASCENETRV